MEDGETQPLLSDDANKSTEEDKQPSKARQWTMMATILWLMLVAQCADNMILPFFPNTATEKNLSNTEIGLVFSAFDVPRFIVAPLCGSLLRVWHPKSMCAIGSFLTASSCVGFGIAKIISNKNWFLVLCITLRLTAGIGSALLNVSGMSIMLKTTTCKVTTITGIVEVIYGLSIALGPAMGAGLFELLGYTAMFCVLGGLMIASLPIYTVVVPKVVEDNLEKRRGYLSLLSIPGLLLLYLHAAMTNFNVSARASGFSEYMTSTFGTSSSTLGLQFALYAVVYILACAVATRIIDKRYTFQMMLIGWIVTPFIVLFVGPSPLLGFIFNGTNYAWLTPVAMATTYTVVPTLYIPPLQAAINQMEVHGYEKDSLHTYGMVTGMVNSGFSLGTAVGPILCGVLTDTQDYPSAVTYLTSTNIIMVILMAVFLCHSKMTKKPLYISINDDTEEITGRHSIQ